jgi:O-antigen/teichoic acid export membrane protein
MARKARDGNRPLTAAFLVALLLLGVVPGSTPSPARAEEPMLTIMKNTLYGAITGLILGGTLTLVVEKEKRDDVVRWGIVIGTFAGFAYGLYEASRGEEDLLSRRLPSQEPKLLDRGPLALRMDVPLAGQLAGGAPARFPGPTERNHEPCQATR